MNPFPTQTDADLNNNLHKQKHLHPKEAINSVWIQANYVCMSFTIIFVLKEEKI